MIKKKKKEDEVDGDDRSAKGDDVVVVSQVKGKGAMRRKSSTKVTPFAVEGVKQIDKGGFMKELNRRGSIM